MILKYKKSLSLHSKRGLDDIVSCIIHLKSTFLCLSWLVKKAAAVETAPLFFYKN